MFMRKKNDNQIGQPSCGYVGLEFATQKLTKWDHRQEAVSQLFALS
jgi:hypothetical protein